MRPDSGSELGAVAYAKGALVQNTPVISSATATRLVSRAETSGWREDFVSAGEAALSYGRGKQANAQAAEVARLAIDEIAVRKGRHYMPAPAR